MMVRRWTAALLGSALLFFCALPAAALSSLSAAVYEPESGTFLWEQDADTRRPMASTTKLMTALLAAERLSPDTVITVPAAALPVEGSQVGLAVGDRITVNDLLACLLLSSGNDAANVLALSVSDGFDGFAQQMNRRAAELGMISSHFVTPSGLDAPEHGASARDMALLGAQVLREPLLAELCARKTATVSINGSARTLSNHNKLLRLYDGCIGLKTGFTKKSGRCLVSAATRNGVTLIIATLNGGDYWNDHISLYQAAFSRVRRETMPSVELPRLPVAGGTEGTIALRADEPPTCVLLDEETVSSHLELPAFVWADVPAEEPVGNIVYTAGERVLAKMPIYLAEPLTRRPVPGFWKLLWRHFCTLARTLLE